MKINGKTKLYGIIGWPVEHTFSPSMHNAAFAALRINAAYVPFAVKPARLKDAVLSLKALNISGANVTVPHKQEVIKFLDKIDPLAKSVGSVNTIKNQNGILAGYNTDGIGFIKDIRRLGFNPRGKTALVVGSGGAGRAVVEALSWAGAKKIFVTDKFEPLSKALAAKAKNAVFVPFKTWADKVEISDILVNATPVGMRKNDPPILGTTFPKKGLFVYDLVYNRKTKLVRDAKKAGLKAYSGIGMLLNQGTAAFEIWTSIKAPVKIMERALKNSVKKSLKRS